MICICMSLSLFSFTVEKVLKYLALCSAAEVDSSETPLPPGLKRYCFLPMLRSVEAAKPLGTVPHNLTCPEGTV